MKFVKWKILILTCIVCLASILPGLILWDKLPESVAIHFNIHNQPDNFASRGFAVFGMPCLMVLLQIICCVINDVNAHKHGERKKFETATKWIIPVMAFVLQIITLLYALGINVDIRRVAMIVVSLVFLLIGNYLPKFNYVKNYDIDTEKARKINRFVGFETVIMGILGLVGLFLPPVASVIWLVLMIPYAVIAVIYSVAVIKRNN